MTKEPKLSKQELEIAMAACCVGTMWDEYEGTEDFDHMVRLRLNHLIELVRKSQPSLPSNIDEAEEEASQSAYSEPTADGFAKRCFFKRGFKAGAEWMAEQGVTSEGEILDVSGKPLVDRVIRTISIKDMEQCLKNFNKGDKVVVQIRKK